MCIESPRRCGVVTPWCPYFSFVLLPGKGRPKPSLPSVGFRFCKPQCCFLKDPGSWTGIVLLVWHECRRYLLPICDWECLHETPCSIDFVLVDLLPHLLTFSPAANVRQQIIFLHNPQHGFEVEEDILIFQPQPHPPVGVGAKTAFLLI